MKTKKITAVIAMDQEAVSIFSASANGMLNNFKTITGSFKKKIDYECIISGIGPERASEAAKILCREKPDLIMNIGVSGGLAAGLPAGSLVQATSILSDVPEFDHWHAGPADTRMAEELLPDCGKIQCGRLVTTADPVLTPEDKMLLHERTGALAVDMESIAVAKVAEEAGIPFMCIRAISDSSDREIPAESLEGVDENGKTRLLPILKAIARHPSLVLKLIPMGMDYSKALKALGTIFK